MIIWVNESHNIQSSRHVQPRNHRLNVCHLLFDFRNKLYAAATCSSSSNVSGATKFKLYGSPRSRRINSYRTLCANVHSFEQGDKHLANCTSRSPSDASTMVDIIHIIMINNVYFVVFMIMGVLVWCRWLECSVNYIEWWNADAQVVYNDLRGVDRKRWLIIHVKGLVSG